MDAVLPYRAMAYNNGWANHRLLAACVRLPQADFVASRTGFFPSLRATLNHILTIDLFYVDAMEGGTLGPAAWAWPISIASWIYTAVTAFNASGSIGCCFTCFSIRFIIGVRRTRC